MENTNRNQNTSTEQKTIEYYNSNAEGFYESTVNADMSAQYNLFEKYLGEGAHILDCGCGSGRDSKHFLDSGFEVTAIDGSEELCKKAREYTGLEIKHMYFQDLDFDNEFDGIWACASLLHVEKKELPVVLNKLAKALRDGGILYVSFKYGDFSGERNGRFFTDLDDDSFKKLIAGIPTLTLKEKYISTDVRPGREDERWLNAIVTKHNPFAVKTSKEVAETEITEKLEGKIVYDEKGHKVLKIAKTMTSMDFMGTLGQLAQVVNIANITNTLEKGAEYIVQIPVKYQKQFEAGEYFINKNSKTGIEWPTLMKKAENGRNQFVDNLPIKREEFIQGNPFQDMCNSYNNIIMEQQIARIAEKVEETFEVVRMIEKGQQDDRAALIETGRKQILLAMTVHNEGRKKYLIDTGLDNLMLGQEQIGKALKLRVESFKALPDGRLPMFFTTVSTPGYLDKKDKEVEAIQDCYSMYIEATKMIAATLTYEGEMDAVQQVFNDSTVQLKAIDFSKVKTIERAHKDADLSDWFFNRPAEYVEAEKQPCLEMTKSIDYLQIEVSGEDLLEAIENGKQDI